MGTQCPGFVVGVSPEEIIGHAPVSRPAKPQKVLQKAF